METCLLQSSGFFDFSSLGSDSNQAEVSIARPLLGLERRFLKPEYKHTNNTQDTTSAVPPVLAQNQQTLEACNFTGETYQRITSFANTQDTTSAVPPVLAQNQQTLEACNFTGETYQRITSLAYRNALDGQSLNPVSLHQFLLFWLSLEEVVNPHLGVQPQ